MALGFRYNGIHSDTYSLVMKSIDRPLLPPLRKRDLTIPGRHGSYDFSGNTYDNRILSMEISYLGNSISALRSRAREISAWLSQTENKQLIFDDEPEKYYLAKIYDAISFENLFLIGKTTLGFECQPFAYSTSESNQTFNITADGQEITIVNSGSVETPQIITIRNTGTNTISGFTITRREES